ncbi:MAG: alpha-L-fucosidase [Herbinix sp.]|nr:alpha-L-fucosidase [Herbinix sp.]
MKKEFNKLVIDQLPKKFNEGLFWGNGQIGGFLYVVGNSLRFSVDNVRLWETRDTHLDEPAGKFQDFIKNPELFHNGTYTKQTNLSEPSIYRTHLPGLSLNIALEDEIVDFYGEIDFQTASSDICVTLKNGKKVNCFVYVDSNVNILKVKLDTTNSTVEIKGWDTENGNLPQLAAWNYPKYQEEKTNEITHVLQSYSERSLALISLIEKPKHIYITLNADDLANEEDASAILNSDLKDKLVNMNSELLNCYVQKEETFQAAHEASWAEFWNRSDINIPNDRLQHAFYTEMYKIFANERKTSWPVTLQGVWNNDARMPAWFGDWHNDLNVQSCYWAVYKTNNIELAEAYIDYYTKCMPRLTERAYKLFGIENAIHCPVMMGPDGYGVAGEWCFWNELLGPEMFVAADFCWYYEFSRNVEKLKSSVYPFVERVINLYQGIAYEGEDGYLHIPFTNSPEVFKNGSLIKDDATIVVSTLHYLLENMERYAKVLGIDGSHYVEFKKKLTPVKTTEKGYPLFPDEEVFDSHRHFCHLFPIFPLGTDTHSKIAEKSVNTVVDKGFMEYAAWSFPYMSIFASRIGRGNMARMMLEIYCMAFRARNTFVVNGDPNNNGMLKISDTNAGETSDAFTVEAGFIVPAALSEMFVHRSKNTVYVAYGIPDEWNNCSCSNLTVEGGHRISVVMEKYAVKSVTVEANCDETVEFSFAKLRGNLSLDGMKLAPLETYPVALTKGKTVTFEVYYE